MRDGRATTIDLAETLSFGGTDVLNFGSAIRGC